MNEIKSYAIDAAICSGGNSTAQGKCWYDDISPTLNAGGGTRGNVISRYNRNT